MALDSVLVLHLKTINALITIFQEIELKEEEEKKKRIKLDHHHQVIHFFFILLVISTCCCLLYDNTLKEKNIHNKF